MNYLSSISIMLTIIANRILLSEAHHCANDTDCRGKQMCFNGSCGCASTCPRDLMLICADDGAYYQNLCYLRANECERDIDIGINRIGFSNHCCKDRLAVRARQIEDHQIHENQRYCMNYGVHVTYSGVSWCVCSKSYNGVRCETKTEIMTNASFYHNRRMHKPRRKRRRRNACNPQH